MHRAATSAFATLSRPIAFDIQACGRGFLQECRRKQLVETPRCCSSPCSRLRGCVLPTIHKNHDYTSETMGGHGKIANAVGCFVGRRVLRKGLHVLSLFCALGGRCSSAEESEYPFSLESSFFCAFNVVRVLKLGHGGCLYDMCRP